MFHGVPGHHADEPRRGSRADDRGFSDRLELLARLGQHLPDSFHPVDGPVVRRGEILVIDPCLDGRVESLSSEGHGQGVHHQVDPLRGFYDVLLFGGVQLAGPPFFQDAAELIHRCFVVISADDLRNGGLLVHSFGDGASLRADAEDKKFFHGISPGKAIPGWITRMVESV